MRFNAILSTDLQRRMKQWPWRLWRLKTVLKSHLHDNSRRTARKTCASIRSKRQEIQKRHTTEQEREREKDREREGKKAPIPSRSQEYFAKTSTKMAIAAAGAWNH